ncbi:hypothetical protein CerSpe_157510 [Prunus speciosa]
MSASPDADVSKIKISERASDAMEELLSLALAQEPLWQVDKENNTEMLSDVEYMRVVKVRECQSPPTLEVDNSHELDPVRSESSRAVEYFKTSPISIIELLMDLEQWSVAFSNIVSKATLVGVLASTGVERHYDGTLQLDETKKLKALYMQESYTASTGSYIVYAPFDYKDAGNKLMKDECPDHITILPSGFSILPDRSIHREETGGSLLTIAFHVVVKSPTDEHEPSSQLGLLMHNIIAKTVMSIKEALGFSI